MAKRSGGPGRHTLDRESRSTYLVTLALLGASLLTAVGGWLYVNRVSQTRVERLIAITRLVRQTHEAMLDQETGLRGYLATGRDDFLNPYDQGRTALVTQERRLVREISSEPDLVEMTVDLRLRMQEWMAFAESARSDGPVADAKTAAIVFDRDRRLFQPYRYVQSRLADELVERRDEALRDQRTVLGLIVAVEALCILATLIFFARRSARLRRLVATPLKDLLAATRRVQQGEAECRVEPAGLHEIHEVGEGFNEMAAAIDEQSMLATRREQALVQQTGSLTEILRLSREIAGNLNIRYVQEAVANACRSVTNATAIVIYLTEEHDGLLVPTHDSRGPAARLGTEPLAIGEGMVGEAASSARRVIADDAMALPMVVGARVIGVLEFNFDGANKLSQQDLEIVETLSTHSATAIEAARLHESTKELSTTDALTRLPNRRRFDEELKLEVERSGRYERPLALIMLDVDHFKSLNDTFGHQAGDEVLQTLAEVLQGELRGSDTAYRYGGEEFAMILRETTGKDALQAAERIRATVERRFSGWRDGRSITVSVGMADMSAGPEPELLVAAADGALYRAKAEGRNRVVSDVEVGDQKPSRARGPVRPVD